MAYKTALIVIDFINDIMNLDSKVATSAQCAHERGTLVAANRVIAWARANQHLVVMVKVGFDKSYHLQPKQSPMFGKADQYGLFQLGTWGTDFHPDLDVDETDLVIEKPRVNPFYATQLDAALRANKIEQVVLCGVSSALCIQSAARDAHDRDYLVTVVEDACAAATEEDHQMAIKLLTRFTTITTSTQLAAGE